MCRLKHRAYIQYGYTWDKCGISSTSRLRKLQPLVSKLTVGPTIRSSHRVEHRVTPNQYARCGENGPDRRSSYMLMPCHRRPRQRISIHEHPAGHLEAEVMWHARCPLLHRLFRFAASTLSRVHLPTYILSRTAPCPNSWGYLIFVIFYPPSSLVGCLIRQFPIASSIAPLCPATHPT